MNLPQFRLEPIMDLVRGEPLGFELLAGASRCPDWSEDGWRAFYIDLPELFRSHIPASARVFINLDSRQVLDHAIVDGLLGIEGRHRLVVEWTEHFRTAIAYEKAGSAFARLKQYGFALAIDDVGAGYDGIGRTLRVLPAFAKLDMSLTRLARRGQPFCAHDPELVSLFGANIAKPRFLRDLNDFFEGVGARVIAEGIESADDLERVRTNGIRYGQGYYFASWKGGASTSGHQVRIPAGERRILEAPGAPAEALAVVDWKSSARSK